MSSRNFVSSYDELIQFLQSYRERLFYVDLQVDPPPTGARSFGITTFPDEIALDVIRQIHSDTNPPRMTPDVKDRIDTAAILNATFGCGMNIDPTNPQGKPNPSLLRTAKWVRFPFISRLYERTIEQAFAFYDPIINAYHAQGTNVLLVVNHQTFGEGAGYNWNQMDSGKWAAFTNQFIPVLDQVTYHYKGKVAGYEVWNEGDVPNNPASVYIPPADFAPLLERSSFIIQRNTPGTKVVLGGLVGGSGISSAYVRDVRARLGGRLPVDGIGLHPYGLGAPGDTTPYSPFGNIQTVLDALWNAAPNTPVWVTEFGALGSREPSFYPQAAEYMRRMYVYLRQIPHKVPTAIWWAWSDAMDFSGGTNGLVDVNGNPKQPIYDTFFNEACG